MWPCPRGKYQTSPGSKSLVSANPFGSITVVRTRPSRMKAHSAAVACQCSSRIAPTSSRIDTPAMPFEIGNCVTVASLPKLPPITLPCDFSSANLKVGNSLPERSGSGTLFMKLGSPAAAGCEALSAASAATPAAATRKSRRSGSDMLLSRCALPLIWADISRLCRHLHATRLPVRACHFYFTCHGRTRRRRSADLNEETSPCDFPFSIRKT